MSFLKKLFSDKDLNLHGHPHITLTLRLRLLSERHHQAANMGDRKGRP
jgi:hypothetical protein